MAVLSRVIDAKMAEDHTSYEYRVQHVRKNEYLDETWILDDCFVGKKEIEYF